MAGNLTFAMIKPDAVSRNEIGAIITLIENNGFRVVAMKKTQLTQSTISLFYKDHIGKSYFKDLEQYMTTGSVIPLVLEKENAVKSFRTLLGATDPADAAEGTIRKLFATAKNRNSCHGADSDDNALYEASCFFTKIELL